MKERILFGASPFAGHLAPMLPLARQLQDEGHAVAVASHPLARVWVEREGVPLVESFGWGKEASDIIMQKAKQGHIYRTLIKERKFGLIFYLFTYELERAVQDFLRVIDEWKPDVCVFDILFFPGIIAAEARGIPYASSSPLPSPLASRDLLPYGFGFPSQQRRMNWGERMMNGVADWYWGLNTRYVNRVRASYSLPPITDVISGCASPYLYLSYTTARFEYPRSDLPPQVFYIGPARNRNTSAGSDTFPWDKLGDQPLIYFTMGTLQGNRKVISRMIEASRGAPWQVVITLGQLFDPKSFGDIPPNVLLFEWAPQAKLLKRATAVVCHGAFNTVNDALCEGLPMLLVPPAWDQIETAQRVVEAGAGLRVNVRDASVKALREGIVTVLGSAELKAGAVRLAEDFARCDSARTGASLIRELAQTRRSILRSPGEAPTLTSPRQVPPAS